MNIYTITTNERVVEWKAKTGKAAREEFWILEIAPKKNADPEHAEKIKSVKLKRKRYQQLTILDDPTYHE